MEIDNGETGSLRGLTINDRDVHIWRASLKQSSSIVRELRQVLSRDEVTRAARFHFAHDREAFIVARGILRWLLAGYVHAEPHQLTFWYESLGKPHLSDKFADQVHFNVSHSRDLVLFAIGHQPKIGIDIEHIHPIPDMEQIAARNFSPRENAQLQSLPPHMTLEGFFTCWTRKEAYVKAIGTGVSYPLQDFDVSLIPDQPAKLLSMAGSEAEAACWSMFDLKPSSEYAAAVVIEGTGYSIVYREWTHPRSATTI